MAKYCLPRELTAKFLDALRSGDLKPNELRKMSSDERKTEFAKYIGEDHALDLNISFESKMLLKDQQRGMMNWVNDQLGLNETARRDIVSKIQNMKKVLDPKNDQPFLEDLAAKKLNTRVTSEEAKAIYDLSKVASDAKAEMIKDPTDQSKRMAYGNAVLDLSDKVEELKPNGMSIQARIIDAANIPKSMLTSILHMSAPFVQGWGMMSTARAWEGFGQMFKYFADETNYRNLQAYIISHPDYYVSRKAGLAITDLSDHLTSREEAIQSTLVEKANQYLTDKSGVPNLVRASSRAFTGYLNYVRFSRYTDLLQAARMVGEDVSEGSTAARELAMTVNNFTGRGNIGLNDSYKNVAPVLNTIFFSPRKIVATAQMFNPYEYIKEQSPTARAAKIRQLLGSVMMTGAVYGIATAMGAKVDIDPRGQKSGKIGIGDTYLDMTGGQAIYIRLLAQTATGQSISAEGKLKELNEGYNPTGPDALLRRYIRGKLSPIASAVTDFLVGSDQIGNPVHITDLHSDVKEIRERLTPIIFNAVINYFENYPEDQAAAIPALSAMFGVGLESPLPAVSRSGLTLWGDKVGILEDPKKTSLDNELSKVGYHPNFPPQTINGVKLTYDQYHDYVKLAGTTARAQLQPLVESEAWGSMPESIRASAAKTIMDASRKSAQASVMTQSQLTESSIPKASRDIVRARTEE
jgi:hypothetical protein